MKLEEWLVNGPFTVAEVKRLARAAHRAHEEIGDQIAAGLHNFSAAELDALHTEFDKHPGRFEGAYWSFEVNDLLKMDDDKLKVLSLHVRDCGDTFYELSQNLNELMTSSPEIALKFFHLIREADEMKKEIAAKKLALKSANARVGQVYTLCFTEDDDECRREEIHLRRYGMKWKIKEIMANGRFVFEPENGTKFTYSTPDPWSQFK